MTTTRFRICAVAWLMTLTATATADSTLGVIQLQVNNIRSNDGTIGVAVYNSAESFLTDGGVVARDSLPIENGRAQWQSGQLPLGNYAIAIYHDVNNDGALGTNVLGIPVEPVAFSQQARASFGPPGFEDAVFQLAHSEQTLEIRFESQ